MPHDAQIRRLVEDACLEFEQELRAFLMGVLRDTHAAEDALQRTFTSALSAAQSVNPKTIRGWFFRIALNEARAIKRSDSRQQRLNKAVWDESNNTSDAFNGSDGVRQAVSAEQRSTIKAALDRLDGRYREVVVRRIVKNQTFAEIAKEMERPLGTVLTWMRRALLELGEMNEIKTLAQD